MARAASVVLLALATLVALSCAPRVTLGARCDRTSDCPTGLTCGFGRCRSECIAQRDCPLGASCLLDASGEGTCALEDDPSCPGVACAEPLACVEDECVNLCTRVEECPSGSVCEPVGDGRARCVRLPDGADGGGPSDAGGGDGGACAGRACDDVAQLALGAEHACARSHGGAVWCWGRFIGAGGGDATTSICDGVECYPTPVPQYFDDGATTGLIEDATDVSAGEGFTCILRGDRTWCWGLSSGGLGTGEPNQRFARPVRLDTGGLLGATRDVACTRNATLALRMDGTLVGWGGDDDGGLFATEESFHDLAHAFSPYDAPLDATAIVAGGYHACVMRGDRTWCWGHNEDGQLGREPPAPASSSIDPRAVAVPLTGVGAVSASNFHGCALVGGDAWCWGQRRALGVFTFPGPDACEGLSEPCSTTPIEAFRAADAPPFVSLGAAGFATHDCAIDAEGGVWCWGTTDARDEFILEPTQVTLPRPASTVAAGNAFACAVVAGDVYCWGDDDHAQLGRGAPGERDTVPARVLLP